jgi:hypothetical protein
MRFRQRLDPRRLLVPGVWNAEAIERVRSKA